jgi:uncharacterized cupredoxin-like copper-binding protein
MKRFLTALILVAALATACGSTSTSTATSSTPTGAEPSSPASVASPPPGAVEVQLADFMLTPGDVSVKGSDTVFYVKNNGPTPHNLFVRDSGGKVLMHTRTLGPGESAVLTGTLAPGSYIMYCALPGHESLGMKGSVTAT